MDFLIGFEILEALRCLNMLAKDAKIIVNNQKIHPISINFNGKVKYPENGFELIKRILKMQSLYKGLRLLKVQEITKQ